MKAPKHPAARALRAAAMAYPGTTEDFPWGHAAYKAAKKAFLFMADDEGGGGGFSCSMKLPFRAAEALKEKFAEPTGYGLGRSGWVTLSFKKSDKPSEALLVDWLDESWRAVAPKKLSAGVAPPPAHAARKKPAKKIAAKKRSAKK